MRNTRRMILCALFAALCAICAQIQIPMQPVTMSLALLAVHLCGALLSPGQAATAMAVYVLMGALVSVTSVIQVSRIGSMDYANAGSGYEMDAIAAVIVGGTSMSGGRGSVVGTVMGMLIIAVMNNLLNLWGVPPFLREACKGAIHR